MKIGGSDVKGKTRMPLRFLAWVTAKVMELFMERRKTREEKGREDC